MSFLAISFHNNKMDQNLIEKAPKVNLSAVLSDIRKKIQVRKAKFRIQNTFSIDNNRSPHNAIFPQLPLESKNYIQVSKIKKKSTQPSPSNAANQV